MAREPQAAGASGCGMGVSLGRSRPAPTPSCPRGYKDRLLPWAKSSQQSRGLSECLFGAVVGLWEPRLGPTPGPHRPALRGRPTLCCLSSVSSGS